MYAVVRDKRQVIVGFACDAQEPGSNGLLMPEDAKTFRDPNSDAPIYFSWTRGEEWFEFQYDCKTAKLTKFTIHAPPNV
jgi:hypothetical protein